MSIYEELRKVLQDWLSPEINEIKGELKAIRGMVEGNEKLGNLRHDSLERLMDTRFTALERDIRTGFENVKNDLELHRRLSVLERQREEEKAH
jgi:hypothetical protein